MLYHYNYNFISLLSSYNSKPSLGDRTRQSSIAEMSSILNGTKRQRTLYNTKDSSLMVSILPIQVKGRGQLGKGSLVNTDITGEGRRGQS